MDYWYSGEHNLTLYKTKDFSAPFMKTWMEDTTGYQIEYPVKLIPTVRPMFVLPTRKENTLDVPGRNGLVDLSNALTGFPAYGNRQGDIGYVIAEYTVNDDWEDTLDFLNNAINNKFFYIVLDDDPDYFYYGRLQLNWEQSNNGSFNGVSIHYDLQPYKLGIIEYGRYVTPSSSDHKIFDTEDTSTSGTSVVKPVAYNQIDPTGTGVIANSIIRGPYMLEIAIEAHTSAKVTFTNVERNISIDHQLIQVPAARVKTLMPELIVSNESLNNRCTLYLTAPSDDTNYYYYRLFFRKARL